MVPEGLEVEATFVGSETTPRTVLSGYAQILVKLFEKIDARPAEVFVDHPNRRIDVTFRFVFDLADDETPLSVAAQILDEIDEQLTSSIELQALTVGPAANVLQ